MAKTLIGNIKGKNGRGITSIKKTGTTGSVDTYTITYTDSTTSTFTINNSDGISLQRQIVPSAAVESSATASQAYAAGDYVVVSGVLRKVKSSITKGSAISDSNSTATTVTGEIETVRDSVPRVLMGKQRVSGKCSGWKGMYNCRFTIEIGETMPNVLYTVVATFVGNGVIMATSCTNRTTTSFDVYAWTLQDISNLSGEIDWVIQP